MHGEEGTNSVEYRAGELNLHHADRITRIGVETVGRYESPWGFEGPLRIHAHRPIIRPWNCTFAPPSSTRKENDVQGFQPSTIRYMKYVPKPKVTDEILPVPAYVVLYAV